MGKELDNMLSGKLYHAGIDPIAREAGARARRLSRTFNQTTEFDRELRTKLLKELFKATGEKIYIEPPFHTDYGIHTTIGENFYANYDCIFLDVAPITIGNNVLCGPRVGIYTAGHPVDAEIRNSGLEYGYPIVIGDNVWIGGNTVINPGVTIGNNVVIGSGSVVTKDLPDNVIAVGNPCHVLRPITKEDQIYWQKEKERREN
ncbi:sugar O-acetyltransferase [Xylocopilactobacillus apicola]|uniref:Acetyltransferase n=1 Tax=Xylocopilactobacillus apicola TaxID=2932184 RepID=A0AAU9D698_9LACO|nr:sugar O-acetyltransferase [Xylocopilactobacillus apicola]BDR59364.1 galactoside O-acetyltransferase [Xylocopilactobacillus apicola]